MTTDEVLARLRALVDPGAAVTRPRLLELLDGLVRPDVERDETHDQWVLLEVSQDARTVGLTRFFDFGDEGLPDLVDVGVVFTVPSGSAPTPSLILLGSVGFDDDDRASSERWLAQATHALTASADPVVVVEVFG